MTQFIYHISILFIAAINWGIWTLTIFFIDPFHSGVIGQLFFFFSFFLALFGTFYFFISLVYKKFFKKISPFRIIQVSTRQSLLLSTLVVGSLFMQSFSLLTWYNLIIFAFIIIFLEILFLSRKRTVMYGRRVASSS